MILNDYFDKIYCINLDERTDRWEEAQKEFEKLNIEGVERFSAIKNRKGAIGCRESHLSIIKQAKELGLKNVLIFEDDLLVINENETKINQTVGELDKVEWDLVYLGATVDPNVGRVFPVTENLVRTNFAYTTHAYAINHTMFDFILERAPYHGIIDVFYCQHIVPMGKSFIFNPMVCIQQEGYSDIEEHQADYYWMEDFFNKALNR